MKLSEYEDDQGTTDLDMALKKFGDYFVRPRKYNLQKGKVSVQSAKRRDTVVNAFNRYLYEIAKHCDFGKENEEINGKTE